MEEKRLFLAIKLPRELQKQLNDYRENHLNSRVFKTVDNDNFHLTLLFLGNIKEDKISALKEVVKEAVQKIPLSTVRMQKIKYGPHQRNPRLIWLIGEHNSSLEQLRKEIVKQLSKIPIRFPIDRQRFIPHVTVARVRSYSQLPLPPVKEIEKELSFNFLPSQLWLIESQLEIKGAEYIDRAVFPLKSN